LVGLRAFEIPRAVVTPKAHTPPPAQELQTTDEIDTVIVPAQKDGFERVFLGQNAWWAIRIGGVPIPMKPPVCNGMIAPRDSWMMPPPCNEMIPPEAPRLLAE